MLIQITNTCKMMCSHCMEDSTCEPQHMNDDMIENTLSFCQKVSPRVISISGGEPTLHPRFFECVKKFKKITEKTVIISNGSFIFSKEKTNEMKKLLKDDNVYLQICTHKDYYSKYREIVEKKKKFLELGRNVVLEINPTIYMHLLGRAERNEKCFTESMKHDLTTSCITAASIFYQMPFIIGVKYLEKIGKYCKPMIDWQGNIHFSESWLCPSIGNVKDFDRFNDIIKFIPCGKCIDYQKLINNQNDNYIKIKEMMNI